MVHNDAELLRTERTSLGWPKVVLFCLLVSTLIVAFGGYRYGTGDQIEQLPMILRRLDPTYCTNDFFVNAGTEFGPRVYYARTMAFLGTFLPLPTLFLGLTWLANIGIALVTYLAARRVANGSDRAAMLACVLVMGTPAVMLGGVMPLAQTSLRPFTLACPLALAGLWLAFEGRSLPAAFVIALICPIHPSVCLEVGAIAMTVAGIQAISALAHRKRKLGFVLAGSTVLVASIAAFWRREAAAVTLETDRFIDIVARFRHPHHYIPSTWSPAQYAWALGFLLAFAWSWRRWRQQQPEQKPLAWRMAVCVGIVVLLWLGGYIFVEVFPSRWWTTAQTFRLAFLVNWVGCLVIGRSIDQFCRKRCGPAVVAAFMVSFLSSAMLLAGYGILWNSPWSMVVPSVIIWASFYLVLQHRYRAAALIGALVIAIVVAGQRPAIPDARKVLGELAPAITLSDTHDPTLAMAVFVQTHCPKDAVFLTPPDFGRFRITARRAIVIDFKAFPFQDWAISEWKERLDACYGPIEDTGFPAVGEMDANYRRITDTQILNLQQRYGLSYAVLMTETDSSFPVLHASDHFKLVEVPPSTHAPTTSH